MLLRILGLVPIVAGLATVGFGAAIIPDAGSPSASTESELRFYGAWWVGAGVFVQWLVGDFGARRRELLVFCALLWLGAAGRLIGWWVDGRPHTQLLVLLAAEIAVPLVLVPWQRRVAH